MAGILTRMKNYSELMVALSYTALLYDNKYIAEEVMELEEIVDKLNYEMGKKILEKASKVDNPEDLLSLFHITEATETIADAASEIADIVIRGIDAHPIFKQAMKETDQIISKVKICADSIIIGKTFQEIKLQSKTGIYIFLVKRGKDHIYSPKKYFIVEEGDILYGLGMESGIEKLQELANCKPRA
ncbi:MAG: PhoU domain protein [Candidatus Methanofastidiosum methylothiophilum]|uniref:PhoU domain protein n=1 Tax=Candidatus Methanofastidiosum methylothiophilum TaxID=1705564 RepID=A0A150JK69_9EURY|nr:MAG: PhoU domain protein [Candidatus Methanofastidiosum methylthiophilus]KYC57642.1 MAG: PhoU domain protein [Candidatus Methanofastidiosum methylthiophilus]KYC58468.1 MAG: PhoU domain protein [Candidatus Methanofastidiosum methylthiophilus]OQC52781.1 MAG: PhoU domain protein [Euryarchaeota archaeon ADurb.Bin023]